MNIRAETKCDEECIRRIVGNDLEVRGTKAYKDGYKCLVGSVSTSPTCAHKYRTSVVNAYFEERTSQLYASLGKIAHWRLRHDSPPSGADDRCNQYFTTARPREIQKRCLIGLSVSYTLPWSVRRWQNSTSEWSMIVEAQSLDGVRSKIRRRALITFRLEELLVEEQIQNI